MNRTQPTPGPWMIQRNADKTPRLDCDRRLTIIDRRTFFIATVHADADEHEEITREEQLANARLIAAAPQLLEALKALLCEPMAERTVDAAKRAIRAAQGKE